MLKGLIIGLMLTAGILCIALVMFVMIKDTMPDYDDEEE